MKWLERIVVLGLLFWVASFLRGCMNEHNRPNLEGDTFAISPGGDTLVFNGAGEGGRDLYLLELTSRRVTRIAATPDYEVYPAFSPDGKSIVYAASKPGDRADHIFVRSLDGKTVKQLTAENANDRSPVFSPDGCLIAFTRSKKYNWGGLAASWDKGMLYVMKADGTDIRQLTPDEWYASRPCFTSDGRSIMFAGLDNNWKVAADGSGAPSPLGLSEGEPSYSPDGNSIVFTSGKFAGDRRVFVAKADGSERRMLPYPGGNAEGCSDPTFTPDGKRVIFFVTSWPRGHFGDSKQSLWEVATEGGRPREIAGYALFDDPLRWKPK